MLVLVLCSLFERRGARDRRDLHAFIDFAFAGGKYLSPEMLYIALARTRLSKSLRIIHMLQKAGHLSFFQALEENGKN